MFAHTQVIMSPCLFINILFDISTSRRQVHIKNNNIARTKRTKSSFETVITSVNIKINKAFTCLVQKNKRKKSGTNFKMISKRVRKNSLARLCIINNDKHFSFLGSFAPKKKELKQKEAACE